MAMKFTSLPKSKQFNIVTRFYDPQKEAMKEREERFKREMEEGKDGEPISHYGAGIRGSFRKAGKHKVNRSGDEARRKSNMRLFYIIIILSALLYFVLK